MAVKSGAIRDGRHKPCKGGITMTGANCCRLSLPGLPSTGIILF